MNFESAYKRASLRIRHASLIFLRDHIREYTSKYIPHKAEITPNELFDEMIEDAEDNIRDLHLEDIDGILHQHAVCIKEWCSPMDNFLFQKGSRYMMSESSEYITISDDNIENIMKGVKHTLDQKTFNKFFIKEI